MSFEGVLIDKLNGGLGRTSSAADRVIALVYGMDVTDTKSDIANYKVKSFFSITEVEAAGIVNDTTHPTITTGTGSSAVITTTTKVGITAPLWYHFDEMFRLAPGQKFYLITVPQTITVNSKTSPYTVDQILANPDFINAVRGIDDINVLGFANISDLTVQKIALHNEDLLDAQGNVVIDKTTNLKETVSVCYASKFQAFVKAFSDEHLLIDGIFLEGKSETTTFDFTADANNLRQSLVAAPNVSVVIAQDPAMTDFGTPAAVGTVLGSVAIRKVHEDLGSVDIEDKPSSRKGEENYTLTDSATGRWSNAQLSDGTLFITLPVSEQAAISTNGYIYVGSFKNYGGFFLSGCPTAVESTSDYSFFNFNCVWDKAARLVRTTLIPRVRSNVPVEASTGYIKSTTISYWEGLISKQLETMVAAGNISAFDVYINPAQAPDEKNPLVIKTRLVTNRIVHEFEVELGLTTKLD
ncbi:MAG: DUF2586 family protein [Paludibacteraceae bacterium]|nr:DUF2586 family protein [Paludibacteraceae bacterium]